MLNFYQYFSSRGPVKALPNQWDGMALALIFGVIALFAWGAKQMGAPYHLGQAIPISLSPHALPEYALLTILRLLLAMIISLLFTFIFATWAAKSRHAGRIIIPCIDILQSIPVLSFMSITFPSFIALFPGTRWGVECAAIFMIFTAQVWNMALGFYQSLRTVPLELKEAADMFHLSAWQRFWRIEVPFAMPGLLWNSMLSMSGSWLFIIASEAITVNNQNITLPGVGSYLGLAISQANIHAVGYAIVTMLIVILLYDQLLFRPLLNWAEKFKAEHTAQEKSSNSWVIIVLERARVLKYSTLFFSWVSDHLLNLKLFRYKPSTVPYTLNPKLSRALSGFWYSIFALVAVISAIVLLRFIFTKITGAELLHVLALGCYTGLRVLITVMISTIIWVPIGVWIGLRPRLAEIVQPIAQFLAAFPMNVLFPVVVIVILKYKLNVNIWTTPLMLLGTQWYILFNVIAGAVALPKDLKQVAENFGIKGWQWWKRLILPGIFPYYITGTITAIGNAWNTSIIAEVVSWGSTTLTAVGLGAYITQYTSTGDFPRVALGMSVMGIFVLTLNRLVWRPIYNLAQSRYRLD
jgi:NitT/TauT family transport system permease protein